MEQISLIYFKQNIVDNNFDIPDGVYFAVQDKTEVSCGFLNDVNFDYCEENSIPVLQLKRDGGAIVHFAGNVAWAKIESNERKDFSYENMNFLSSLKDYLNNKGIAAIQAGNDLLVDGFKVASGCAINIPPHFTKSFTAFQININTDVDLIRNICKKEMTKTPKGLGEYGITTEEMVEFVKNYFKN